MKPGDLVRLATDYYRDVEEDTLGLIISVERAWGKTIYRVLFRDMIDWFPSTHLEVVQ